MQIEFSKLQSIKTVERYSIYRPFKRQVSRVMSKSINFNRRSNKTRELLVLKLSKSLEAIRVYGDIV